MGRGERGRTQSVEAVSDSRPILRSSRATYTIFMISRKEGRSDKVRFSLA